MYVRSLVLDPKPQLSDSKGHLLRTDRPRLLQVEGCEQRGWRLSVDFSSQDAKGHCSTETKRARRYLSRYSELTLLSLMIAASYLIVVIRSHGLYVHSTNIFDSVFNAELLVLGVGIGTSSLAFSWGLGPLLWGAGNVVKASGFSFLVFTLVHGVLLHPLMGIFMAPLTSFLLSIVFGTLCWGYRARWSRPFDSAQPALSAGRKLVGVIGLSVAVAWFLLYLAFACAVFTMASNGTI